MAKETTPEQSSYYHYPPRLSSSAASNLSDERKYPCQHHTQYLSNTSNTPCLPKGPAYWDNLSTIWFTKGALKELDRRNDRLKLRQNYRRPVTRQTERKKSWKPQFAPEFLRDCAPSCLKQLERLSRLGGPDLSDLRNVCVFYINAHSSTDYFKLSIPNRIEPSTNEWTQASPLPGSESEVCQHSCHSHQRPGLQPELQK